MPNFVNGLYGISDSDTLRRVFERLKPNALAECLYDCLGKHRPEGSPGLVGQFVVVLEQQAAQTLETAALIVKQLFLHAFASVIHGLGAKAHDVKVVDDDLRVEKEGSGHIPKTATTYFISSRLRKVV